MFNKIAILIIILSGMVYPITFEAGSVKGTVKDIDGNPLIGANVFLSNTSYGTSADKNGEFFLTNIPTGDYQIIFSSVGYEKVKQFITIKKNETVEVIASLRNALLEMGSIVVTGTSTPYLYEESPVKTEVIPRKVIDQTASLNLADALGFQTGVRVENNCQNCNFTQVRIMGFEGKYSQILIDGEPVVSSLASVYVLEQFPEEMINRLEIIKGGGSSIYGAGSVAGTINLITQKPQLNRGKFSYMLNSLEGVVDNKLGGVAELISDDGKLGAFLYGSSRFRNQYDRNGDGYSELGKLDNQSFGADISYRPFNSSIFEIGFHRIQEDRRGGNDFELKQHEADIAEGVNHRRWGGKVDYEQNINKQFDFSINYSFSYLERDSYYGGLGDADEDGLIGDFDRIEALNFYGFSENLAQSFSGRVNYVFGNQRFSGGIQYDNDYLKDNSVNDERYHIDKAHSNFGLFIQDDISLFDNVMNLIIGSRIDKHSELEQVVISPRLNLKFILREGMNLRLGFSTGFRPPATFDEDLHIESLGGNQRVIRNSQDLAEEKSYSVSAGLEYQGFVNNTALMLGITGFYTKLDNAFVINPADDINQDLVVWERTNSDGAKMFGAEIDFGIKPLKEMEIRSGLTFTRGTYDSEQEIFEGELSEKFLRSPELYGYIRAAYDILTDLNVLASLRYTGPMTVPNEAMEKLIETEKSFYEFDFGIEYKISAFNSLASKIKFGIKNAFDSYQEDLGVGVDRDPAYLYGPQLPRRIYIGIETGL